MNQKETNHTNYIFAVVLITAVWMLLSGNIQSQDRYYYFKKDSTYGYHKIERDTMIFTPYATIIVVSGQVHGYSYDVAQKAFIRVSIPYLTKPQLNAREERRDSIRYDSIR